MEPCRALCELPNELLLRIAWCSDNDRAFSAMARANRQLYHLLRNELYRYSQDVSKNTALTWAASRGRIDILRLAARAGLDLRDSFVLIQAIVGGKPFFLRECLAYNGGNANVVDAKGKPLLYYAVEHFQVESTRLLLERGASVHSIAPPRGISTSSDSCLFVACQRGFVDVARVLLDYNAPPNQLEMSGLSCLRSASLGGHADVVRLLLERGAAPDTGDNGTSLTSMHSAAANGHVHVVACLLDHGATIDPENFEGETPLTLAADRGRTEMVELLLRRGANLRRQTVHGWSALRLASDSGHAEVIRLLFAYGAKLETEDNDDWPALTLAANKGHIEACKILLAQGADVEACNMNEWSPLRLAADGNHLELISVLISQGAGVSKKNSHGWTALHMAADGDLVQAFKLLIDHGADLVEPDVSGSSPLIVAASQGSVEVVKLILSWPGAALMQKDNHGRTPFFHAAMRGHDQILRLFLEHHSTWRLDQSPELDGEPNLSANQKDCYGTSPLCAATRNGHGEVVPLLLACEIPDPGELDGFGKTLLYWAYRSGKQALVDQLKSYGAGGWGQNEDSPDWREVLDPNPFVHETKVCWCDVCTRSSIHATSSRACEVCDDGAFLICGECRAEGIQCHDPGHSWKTYLCQGSTFDPLVEAMGVMQMNEVEDG